MADLLPERLSTYYNDEEAKGKTKKPAVTNILEWLQCFSIYVAIRGQNNLNVSEISWDIRLSSSKHIWNTRVIAGWVMTDVSDKYVHPNLAGAGLQYIPHYGTWHSLGRPRPRDARIASVFHIRQVIVSSPQVAGHNVLTSFLPPTKDHSADSSAFSGMKLNLSPAHILIVNFNMYAIYAPMMQKQ